MWTQKKKFIILICLVFCIVGLLIFHAVNNSLSKEDNQYIPLYLRNIKPLSDVRTYDEEIGYIISIQNAVLKVAPGQEGLSFGQRREPKELYEAKKGLCYDRSRVIEKILRYSHFRTRHISLYSKEKVNSSIAALFTPGVASHAITEVLTKKGWLIVDSNESWVSLDEDKQPVSIDDVKTSLDIFYPIQWDKKPPFNIYLNPFVFVYGLYSRHGYFYPPYNFFPDIHYGEFIQNLFPR